MRISSLLAVVFLIQTGFSQSLQVANDPAAFGFVPERLDRIDQVINAEVEAGKIPVVFQEMPVIRRIDYEGQSFVSVTDILERFRERNVGLSVAQAYDPARVERARNVIVDLLGERGRQNASVEVEVYDIPPRAVGVTFQIDEGAP